MSTYWRVINLDKMESINPHDLGGGAKLGELLTNHPGVGAALILLCCDRSSTFCWGQDNSEYADIAESIIGRWAGDRVQVVNEHTYGSLDLVNIAAWVQKVINHEFNDHYDKDGFWKECQY